jgi:hypothetical protein
LTPALDSQLGLLGSPSDPVGRFTMREGPSLTIVPATPLGTTVTCYRKMMGFIGILAQIFAVSMTSRSYYFGGAFNLTESSAAWLNITSLCCCSRTHPLLTRRNQSEPPMCIPVTLIRHESSFAQEAWGCLRCQGSDLTTEVGRLRSLHCIDRASSANKKKFFCITTAELS